jgi:5-dehydro-2-deoxygluconokinase
MTPLFAPRAHLPVLVLGRAGMDMYADPPGTRIAAATRFMPALGGSAANIAVALVRQGQAANLLTVVSDDAVGDYVLAELARYGVGHAHVTRADAPNSLAVVETRNDDCRNVIYRQGAADLALALPQVTAVDWAAQAALVVTGTALSANPSASATFLAMDRARAAGLTVAIDLDYRPRAWTGDPAPVLRQAVDMCDIIIGNDVEWSVLAGGEGGLSLAADLSVTRTVVYKMGGAGAITLSGGIARRTGTYPTQALKPTGAGDAFCGGFLAALLQGAPVLQAVHRGSATAAICVSRPGCAPAMPTAPEVLALMVQHPKGP